MKFGRIACLAGLVAMGAWSVSACSSDDNSNSGDGGTTEPDGGGGDGGGNSTGGKGGTGGTAGSSGSAGKAGSSNTGGNAGAGGEKTDSGSGEFDGGAPMIKITKPADKGNVGPGSAYPDYPKFPIEFTVGNFTLMAPGSGATKCPEHTCGHVHLNIDGNDCNVDANTPYNNAGFASPIVADLSLCGAGVPGAHTVTLSLHNDNHSDVSLTDGGAAVSAEIVINAAPAGDGGTVTDAGNDH